VTLKGHFVSATTANAKFRYYQSHMPDKGHRDFGRLRLTVTKQQVAEITCLRRSGLG
jgi:hypothetical protein